MTRAGTEGPPGGPKRQRWWCEPKTGKKHRFRETLPRIIGHDEEGHTCPECSSRLEPWEGQPAPRLYEYPVRDIAWALARVSEGQPYRSVAAQVRARAGRMLDTERRKDPVTKKWLAAANEHGQLVSDWVEVYAPVIWAAYAPTAWPGQAILDEDEMRYTRPGVARGVRAFYVLAVFGYTPRGHRYVASIEAVPRLSIQAWQRHLSRLDGAPDVMVSDGGQPITGAVAQVWPNTETRRCEYHLARNLTEALPRDVQRDLDDPLHEALTGATSSLNTWEAFLTTLQNRAALEPQVFSNALTVAAKLDRVIRGQLPTRNPMGMNSTGPLEHFYRELDQHIGDRAAKMTNKRRADALLMLMAARYNRWGSEKSWTELIRNHLTTAKGRAREQRQHTDSRTHPSLR